MTSCSVFHVILSAPYYFIGEKKTSFEKVKFQKGSIRDFVSRQKQGLEPSLPHTANISFQSLLLVILWVTIALPLQGEEGKQWGGGLSWITEFLVWSPLTWDSPKHNWSLSYAWDSFGYCFTTKSINIFIDSTFHFTPHSFPKREWRQW